MALSFHSTTISLCVPVRHFQLAVGCGSGPLRQLRAPGFAVRGVDASPGASWVSALTKTGRSPGDELLLLESLALSDHTSRRVQGPDTDATTVPRSLRSEFLNNTLPL